MPGNIPANQGTLTLNFFASRATTQLEIGPYSSRDRCLSPTVGGESICQPTMDTDPMSSQRSEIPTSHSNTGGTSVEVTGIVPGTTVSTTLS